MGDGPWVKGDVLEGFEVFEHGVGSFGRGAQGEMFRVCFCLSGWESLEYAEENVIRKRRVGLSGWLRTGSLPRDSRFTMRAKLWRPSLGSCGIRHGNGYNKHVRRVGSRALKRI